MVSSPDQPQMQTARRLSKTIRPEAQARRIPPFIDRKRIFDVALGFFLGMCGSDQALAKQLSLPASTEMQIRVSAASPQFSIPRSDNVLPIHVFGGPDRAYITLTICVPGTSECQTIPKIVLDTGSSGLHLNSSALALSLPSELDAHAQVIAERQGYSSGVVTWGSVRLGDVVLGNERANWIPIQVINPKFAGGPPGGSTGTTLGGNGVLGTAPMRTDCGQNCATTITQQYFSCRGTTCSAITLPISQQLVNPIHALPFDNNGLIVRLPAVPDDGAPEPVVGSLTLGIGTQPDNMPSKVNVIKTDGWGQTAAKLYDRIYQRVIFDTGALTISFPTGSTPVAKCGKDFSGYLCPPTPFAVPITLVEANGMEFSSSIRILDRVPALLKDNARLVDNGVANEWSNYVSIGLPFFMGKTIYFGIEDSSTPLGDGPFVAF
ncbi:MAG TPA: DUF3443 family protein [Beijerinckiaceae bacterium]|nr:DUF3443 family protein [Beijerinckiaceae bacterium]